MKAEPVPIATLPLGARRARRFAYLGVAVAIGLFGLGMMARDGLLVVLAGLGTWIMVASVEGVWRVYIGRMLNTDDWATVRAIDRAIIDHGKIDRLDGSMIVEPEGVRQIAETINEWRIWRPEKT